MDGDDPNFGDLMEFIPKTSQILGIGREVVSSSYMIKMFLPKISLIRHFEIQEGNIVKKRRKNIYHDFFTKKEGRTYKKRRKYIYLIISKKEGFSFV